MFYSGLIQAGGYSAALPICRHYSHQAPEIRLGPRQNFYNEILTGLFNAAVNAHPLIDMCHHLKAEQAIGILVISLILIFWYEA